MASTNCSSCGSALLREGGAGICPACLLALALAPPDAEVGLGEAEAELTPLLDRTVSPLGLKLHHLGDYEMIEEIARGGMGVVFRVRQIRLNRIVALKLIVAGTLASPESIRRFHLEAEAAAKLNHPNIVPIYEISESQGQHFFTMKLIAGGTLAQHMSRFWVTGADSAKRAARLVELIAEAVHYAHQRGILHRDLKPGNILLDDAGQPHVADFGLAKALEGSTDMTMTHTTLGTPSYMAPEQAAGGLQPLSTAADIYSLGTILFEMLTGRTPFRGENAAATLRLVMEEDPPRPRLLNPAIDRDLEVICLKCLQKDPDLRYGSAGALAEELRRWLAGEPIVARPVAGWERARKWIRRKPAVAALAAVSVVATLAVVGLAVAIPAYREVAAARDEETRQRRDKDLALQRVELALYHRNMAWAEREWEANHVKRVKETLAQCPEPLRSWEWGYLDRLCHSDMLTLSATNVGTSTVLAWHPTGQWLRNGTENGSQLWNLQTGSTESRLHLPWHRRFYGFLPSGFKAVVEGNHGIVMANLISGESTSQKLQTAFDSVTQLSPDGSLLAVGSSLGNVRLYLLDRANQHRLKESKSPTNRITGIAFRSDSRQIAYCSGKTRYYQADKENSEVPGAVVLWDLDLNRSQILADGSSVFLCIAFSFDGKYVIAGTADHSIRVWDATTYQLVATLHGHTDAVLSLSPSPTGPWVASSSSDRTIRVWDLMNRVQTQIFRGHEAEVTAVAFSPNGRCLASVSADKTIKIWDAMEPIHGLVRQSTNELSAVAFDPTGDRVLASGKALELLDLRGSTSKVLWQRPMAGHQFDAGGQVALHPDGLRFAATGDGNRAQLMDLRLGTILRSMNGGGFGVAISPDGEWLAVGASGRGPSVVQVWNLETGELARTLTGHTNAVWDVQFSPDGRFLASASGGSSLRPGPSQNPGEVKLWDLESGRAKMTFSTRYCAYRVAFSPDGQRIAAGGGLYQQNGEKLPEAGELNVWALPTSQLLWGVYDSEDCVFALKFSPDGRRLAAAGGKLKRTRAQFIKLRDASTGQELLSLPGHTEAILSLDFSRDGSRLASASRDRTIRIWEAQRQTPERQREHRRQLLGLEPEGDTRWIQLGVQQLEAAALSSPTNVSRWQAVGRARQLSGNLESAAEAYSNATELVAENTTVRASIQRARAEIFLKLHRTNEAVVANLNRLGIPARDRNAGSELVDLSFHYTASLANTLASNEAVDGPPLLSPGIQRFGRVNFDLRGGCKVRYGGDKLNSLGSNITGIAVGRACRRIHFLHAALADSIENPPTDAVIGYYLIRRKGLSDQSQPLEIGKHLGVLQTRSGGTNSAPSLIWTAPTEHSVLYGHTVRLYQMTWENPHPESVVETVDLIPTQVDGVTLVLFAMTTE